MPASFKWSELVGKIPGWVKAAFGLIGAIAATVVAFRENWYLYSTVTVILVLVYALGGSLYLLLARKPSRSRQKKWLYTFEKQRPWAFVGLAVVCLVGAGLLAAQPTRQVAMYAFAGTPTPVPPPRVESADVLIAEFDSRYATRTLDVAHRLEIDLEERLHSFGMDDIEVQVQSQPVASDAEAQAAVNDTGSKVVIWGWYDDAGIQVRVFLSGGEQAGAELTRTQEIPLAMGGEASSGLSFVVKDVLPENVSFLSLFVIGHLKYLSNDYEGGRRAFNAAMNNMPETVAIENEAILHFFQARQMDMAGADVTDVICEYASAIELDPTFAEPYNNLGVIMGRLFPLDSYTGRELPSKACACLEEAGLEQETYMAPEMLYHRALDLDPNLTIAEFNSIAYQWKNVPGETWYVEPLEDIQRQDPSILGTYIILGIVDDAAGKPADAIKMYEAGIKVDPKNALLHFNLGQLYLSHEKDEARAEEEFQTVLALAPDDLEVRLALANLYYGQGELEQALGQVDLIPEAGEDEVSTVLPLHRTALILRSAILFEQGQTAQAIQVLKESTQDQYGRSFEYLLLGLLEQSAGRQAQARDNFANLGFYDSSLEDTNDTPSFAWGKFLELCYENEDASTSLDEWALNMLPASDCLPTDMKARIHAVYDIFHDLVLDRRVIPPYVGHILACPYVYSYNEAANAWEFQTTILYRLVGREEEQMRPLTQFDGRLLIREEEPEVSHLNRLVVQAVLSDGSIRTLEPRTEALKRQDADYVVLRQGEEILVTWAGYPIDGEVEQWRVVATGYYEPVYK
ncbi:MAG: tetratricopeptide repeat protein [Chloroflexota bacterium]